MSSTRRSSAKPTRHVLQPPGIDRRRALGDPHDCADHRLQVLVLEGHLVAVAEVLACGLRRIRRRRHRCVECARPTSADGSSMAV